MCSKGGRGQAALSPTVLQPGSHHHLQLFIVITLITLNSLGINEDVMCTWMGIFIVVQH